MFAAHHLLEIPGCGVKVFDVVKTVRETKQTTLFCFERLVQEGCSRMPTVWAPQAVQRSASQFRSSSRSLPKKGIVVRKEQQDTYFNAGIEIFFKILHVRDLPVR